MSKYPASKFKIFVHSNIHNFTDGGFASYSISGVIPVKSNEFPARRYSSVEINGSDKQYNALQLADIELRLFRKAVKSLMDACEISPTCDVYVSR